MATGQWESRDLVPVEAGRLLWASVDWESRIVPRTGLEFALDEIKQMFKTNV
jgi:hypothetical protein